MELVCVTCARFFLASPARASSTFVAALFRRRLGFSTRGQATATLAIGVAVCIYPFGFVIADVLIKVTFDEVDTEISPNRNVDRLKKIREYKLTNDHKIILNVNDQVNGNSTAELLLGGPNKSYTVSGRTFASQARIENKAIVLYNFSSTLTTTTRITTNGVDSCTATRKVRSQSGHKYIELKTNEKHEDIKFEIHFENITCEITQVGN